MDTGLPAFYALEDALYRLDATFSAAEMQGIACGVLAINNEYAFERWLAHVLQGDRHDFHFQEASQMLHALYQTTHQQLNAADMGLELYLPPEQDTLEERMTALQKWCQGFAYGMALSGLKTMSDLPEDSREWVQDVVKIGAARDLDMQESEESEQAFFDLCEFLRVGVLMLNEEMQPVRGRADLEGFDDSSIH